MLLTSELRNAQVCLESERARNESRLGEKRRERMKGRRPAVDFLEEHSARRIDAASRALDEDARDSAGGSRALGLCFGEPGEEHAIAASQVRRQRAVYENHRRPHRSA